MTDTETIDAYGTLSAPDTLTIRRILPGPVERVWSYLTESDLRRKWLAAGDMDMTVGAPFELVWRNNELTDPPGKRPDGLTGEHRMESRITTLEPPHQLGFTWGADGEVTISLSAQGSDVLLTLVHRRLPEGEMRQMIGAGWHAHLDLLVARASGTVPPPFWDAWVGLHQEYKTRIPL
ncbi:SRPBCC family protein [Tropicimonas sp. IMCC34043]|uniref:SRPBCC family protein n=1 Tax=Tropicimonas sp. IMCC34043 TaxID=2248760 RepID=UPI000E2227AF|nr:SRPBCC family protein [Tropicimonas sp. IMCC34043]